MIVFMAHIGSFVPADRAVVPTLDRIFTLFHGNENQTQPFASSFTTGMKQVAEAIAKSTPRSLIVIDEFGKTSNMDDGASLCAAFVRQMAQRGDNCPIVFLSTHFHSILQPRFLEPGTVIPCSMDVRIEDEDEMNLTFLYHLVKGDPGAKCSSFGLQCALRAGLPMPIIERAKIVAECYQSGTQIPPNPECGDPEFEGRSREALTLFFKWDGKTHPRRLLASIQEILTRR
jgi:DNA mismatch repair protein MSH5